ncbi:hypothetical protein R1sor_020184 [Riccia sorocarpa]|uniref:Uncharacterized protein n=1 Tax=Riccia sorocarpa TaxID=122646 RepID=A0ABD3IJ36_9MARC
MLKNMYGREEWYDEKILNPVLKKLKVEALRDLKGNNGEWRRRNLQAEADLLGEKTMGRSSSRSYNRRSIFRVKNTLLSTFDEAIGSTEGNPVLTIILAELIQEVWRDRNAQVFQSRRKRTPIIVTLNRALGMIEGSLSDRSNGTKWQRGLADLSEINKIIQAVTHDANNLANFLDLSLNLTDLRLDTAEAEMVDITSMENESIPWWIADSQRPVSNVDGLHTVSLAENAAGISISPHQEEAHSSNEAIAAPQEFSPPQDTEERRQGRTDNETPLTLGSHIT